MIIFRDCLNETEKTELEELTEACSQADGLRWSAPFDADLYFLFYTDAVPDRLRKASCEEEKQPQSVKPACDLLAALCVFHMGDTKDSLPIDELIALTDPKARRRGCFQSLLTKASPLLRPILRFSLPKASSGTDMPSRHFLLHIGAGFDHDEYLMERKLSPAAACDPSAASDPSALPLRLNARDGLTEVSCRYGECFLSDWSNGVYLFGMLVYERFRGQGYGTRILRALFHRLCTQGCSRVVLEVSSDNLPAIRLYRKMGFQMIEGVSYFTMKKRASLRSRLF